MTGRLDERDQAELARPRVRNHQTSRSRGGMTMPDTIPGGADTAVGDAGETAPVGDPAHPPPAPAFLASVTGTCRDHAGLATRRSRLHEHRPLSQENAP
jgi:hypothetical protein